MKLQEALRKTVRLYGVSIIREKRLMYFLADFLAFDDYPAVKEVIKAIGTDGYAQDLCRFAGESDEAYLRFADSLKESLVRDKNFRKEFADYAVDCISYALGLVPSVTEPGDHGYDPSQRKPGSAGTHGSGSAQGSSESTQKQQPQNSGSGSYSGGTGASGATVSDGAKPSRKMNIKALVIIAALALAAAILAGVPLNVPDGAEAHRGFYRSKDLTAAFDSGTFSANVADGAEAHRGFYRSKDLTAAFDSGTFSANVADGSFKDIYPGDYIMKSVTIPATAGRGTETYTIRFIIADLDYALNKGSPRVTEHHVVIVPERSPFLSYMNPANTTGGGYAGSYMNKTVMPAFAEGLTGAFGAEHLVKSSFDGAAGGEQGPYSGICRLMTLSMVFGQTLPPGSWYSYSDYTIDKSMGDRQLAASRLNESFWKNGGWYWLSDVYSSSAFAYVYGDVGGVYAVAYNASRAYVGVRPFALLK